MPFTMEDRKKYCSKRWNVTDWSVFNEITYGIESNCLAKYKIQEIVLNCCFLISPGINQTSNLIFSNGNLDPWHGGGVSISVFLNRLFLNVFNKRTHYGYSVFFILFRFYIA